MTTPMRALIRKDSVIYVANVGPSPPFFALRFTMRCFFSLAFGSEGAESAWPSTMTAIPLLLGTGMLPAWPDQAEASGYSALAVLKIVVLPSCGSVDPQRNHSVSDLCTTPVGSYTMLLFFSCPMLGLGSCTRKVGYPYKKGYGMSLQVYQECMPGPTFQAFRFARALRPRSGGRHVGRSLHLCLQGLDEAC